MSKTYSAGIVTAYGAAKRAGYQGTYEDFCRQQAGYAGNAAAVEAAKTATQNAANTATTKATEATTAATAAQTAKAQTEQSASQALTDIAAARSGAISAVQTEGQTQTANATAQAQAAATSATTASTKASEASASAATATTKATEAAASETSAAQSASDAHDVLDSIPEDYSEMSADVEQLKADLGELEDAVDKIEQEFPDINGKIFSTPYELGTRYVSNGVEAWSSNNVRMSTKRGEYVSLKQGDIVTNVSSTIQRFGGGYSTDNGSTFISIPAQSGQYVVPSNGIYFFWLSKLNDAVFTDDDIENGASYIVFNHPDNMKSKMSRLTELDMVEVQLPELNGAIVPPVFDIGTRYVSNGADIWLVSNIRMSMAKGKYIELKQGDIVAINGNYVYAYGGGYSIDNGSTWNAISNRIDAYTAPANGIYFFCLAKRNDATFAESEVSVAWKYISFTRPDNIKETLEELVANDATDNIKTAIGYEIEPLTPTDYYTMTNPNKGLNYLGELVDDSGQDASDYIELTNLYDIARVVPNTNKYGLGSVCYYTASKQFITPRVQPGTNYSFSIYNGEVVAWLSIDKTVANAKYVRFCGENNRNYKYWVVYNAPQASVLDDYSKYKLLGKKIVNFGDSIFGLTRPPKDISSYLANITGATVYNAGFGGCEMSNHADTNYNPFSMCNLVDAIVTGTWTTQESAASASGMPAYFAETVALLKTIDFSKVDIVTIGYGTNDWNNGTELDNGGNSNKAYFADALRYSIETLLTAFPNLKIFVCTQTYRFFMDTSYNFVDDSNTHTNSHGKTLIDFVNKTIEIAKEYNLPYINNYNIGIGKYSRSHYFYPTDGTHPKPEGNMLIAHHIAKELF